MTPLKNAFCLTEYRGRDVATIRRDTSDFLERGYYVVSYFTPHSADHQGSYTGRNYEAVLDAMIRSLEIADVLVVGPGWDARPAYARRVFHRANELGLPVIDIVTLMQETPSR